MRCASLRPRPEAASVVAPTRFAYAPDPVGERRLADLLPADPAFLALKTAARSAPNLEAALARIDAARASARAARAARAPDITASGNVSGERGSVASQPGNPFFDRDRALFQPQVQASWDLDIFGGLRASQRAALARLDAAGADADAVRLALDCDIALALIDYREAAAREAVVQRDFDDTSDLVRLTRIRARAGVVAEFDMVRAEGLAKDAAARLAVFAGQKASAVGRLVALTGLDANAVQSFVLVGPGTAMPGDVSAGLPSGLLRNRPDVRAAEYRLAAAKQDVANTAAQRFPKLTLTATLGLLALAAGDLLSGDALTATIGTGVSGPLLDFGRVAAEIDRQDALAREAFATYRAADFLTVVDAQRTLNQTRQNLAAAQWQSWRDTTQLYRALGGLPYETPPSA